MLSGSWVWTVDRGLWTVDSGLWTVDCGLIWTIEATENNFKELPLFDRYKSSLKKKVAVGVISHRTLQADFPNVIAERIRRCLQHIPADKLVLSTDCGSPLPLLPRFPLAGGVPPAYPSQHYATGSLILGIVVCEAGASVPSRI